MSDMGAMPRHVAEALRVALGPDEALEEFVRVYGEERGTVEYAAAHGDRRANALAAAEKVVARARAVAAKNGWDWADVVALAQRTLGLDADWRSPEWHRFRALLADEAARRDARVLESERLRESQTGR